MAKFVTSGLEKANLATLVPPPSQGTVQCVRVCVCVSAVYRLRMRTAGLAAAVEARRDGSGADGELDERVDKELGTFGILTIFEFF